MLPEVNTSFSYCGSVSTLESARRGWGVGIHAPGGKKVPKWEIVEHNTYCLKISKPIGVYLSQHGANWHHFPTVWQWNSGLWFCSNSFLLAASGLIVCKPTMPQEYKPQTLCMVFCTISYQNQCHHLQLRSNRIASHKCWLHCKCWFTQITKQNIFPS